VTPDSYIVGISPVVWRLPFYLLYYYSSFPSPWIVTLQVLEALISSSRRGEEDKLLKSKKLKTSTIGTQRVHKITCDTVRQESSPRTDTAVQVQIWKSFGVGILKVTISIYLLPVLPILDQTGKCKTSLLLPGSYWHVTLIKSPRSETRRRHISALKLLEECFVLNSVSCLLVETHLLCCWLAC